MILKHKNQATHNISNVKEAVFMSNSIPTWKLCMRFVYKNCTRCIQLMYTKCVQNVYKMYTTFRQAFVYILYKMKRTMSAKFCI